MDYYLGTGFGFVQSVIIGLKKIYIVLKLKVTKYVSDELFVQKKYFICIEIKQKVIITFSNSTGKT